MVSGGDLGGEQGEHVFLILWSRQPHFDNVEKINGLFNLKSKTGDFGNIQLQRLFSVCTDPPLGSR